jgi:Raf kinase inhibitor-like YbhB/YbcL family protein
MLRFSDWLKEMTMKFDLKSVSFRHGEEIPRQYTGEGEDESPPLEWVNVPRNTREFVLICEDPDAPQAKPWVHWLMYKIPGEVRKIPPSLPRNERLTLPPNAIQGKNSFGSIGYGGPMQPVGHGPHHYYFRLYALGSELPLKAGATKDEILAAMEGHVLGFTELLGIYERKKELMKKAG